MGSGCILFILTDFLSADFWLSSWVELLAVLIIAVVAYLVYRAKKKKLEYTISDLERQLLERNELLTYTKQKEQNARDEAAQESRNKSLLLSKISHDIRTPMTTMMGMASLLNETTLTQEQLEYTNTISESGDNLLKLINDILINDILEYSRFESGKELEQKDFDLRNTVEEVLEIFAAKSTKQNIELIYHIGSNVPTQLAGDTMRLQQILTNLIKNAMRFTPKGEIFVGVDLLESSDDNRVKLEFEIRDTGLGMPINKLEQLQKGFAEPVSNLNTNGITSGVGLIICKNLIALMGGSMQVESKENDGSTFRFTIWLRTSLQSVRTTRISEMQGLEGKKVLIVDDNVTVNNLLTKQLGQWKLSATSITSGDKALDLLTQNSDFDLILIDLLMPGMSGIELSQAVKALYPNLSIILINKFGDESYKKHAALFSAVINKPIRQHLLAETLLSNLRKAKTTGDVNKQKLSIDFAKENPLRILVAEDDVMNQKMVTKVLNKLGYEPHISNNGNEVLEEVSLNTYDLILMDVQMPEMDGLEATKMIRLCLSVQPTIIAMTANTLQGDRDACMRAGMDDYVSKPVKLEELVNVLEKWSIHTQQNK